MGKLRHRQVSILPKVTQLETRLLIQMHSIYSYTSSLVGCNTCLSGSQFVTRRQGGNYIEMSETPPWVQNLRGTTTSHPPHIIRMGTSKRKGRERKARQGKARQRKGREKFLARMRRNWNPCALLMGR